MLVVLGLGVAVRLGPLALREAGTPAHFCGRIVGARPAALLGRMFGAGVGNAQAQQVLEFKPVPPESVSKLDERGRRRRYGSTPSPPSVPPPSTPSLPEPPPEPSRTEMIVGKTGNIMRIGSDVHVERDQVVAGDLLTIGGDVVVDGHVEGDVVAMGGDVQLNATARVDGDVACIGGELTEEPGASVGGQRVTAAGMRGLRGVHRQRIAREVNRGVHVASHVAASMVWLFIQLVVVWGFASLAPGRTGAALATLRREPALSFGIGALIWALLIPSVVALALVVAVLCITIIGIPLALAALVGYFLFLGLLWVWGYAAAAAAAGELVAARMRLGAPALASGAPTIGTGGAAELAGTGPGLGAGPATGAMALSRKAVLGVLVLGGTGFVGELLQTLFFVPPLQGLGIFLAVVSVVANAVAATFGAGALLRTEIVSGTFRRWWGPRPFPAAPAAAPAGPAPAPTAAGPEAPSPPPA
jgi:hypothetical protein